MKLVSEIALSCSCGKIKGRVENVNPNLGTRLVCCCLDCQRFAQNLGQSENALDQYGGTEIIQLPVSYLKITLGCDQIKCLRLSSKGLYRWYAGCCDTLIGNTLGAGAPFIGLIHTFIDPEVNKTRAFGEIRGHIQTKSARENIPAKLKGSDIGIALRSLMKLLIWKMKGLNNPSEFFDANGAPIIEPITIE